MGKFPIPRWIYGWGMLVALLPTGFVLSGYFNAETMFGKQAAAEGVAMLGGPIGLYISRNAAEAAVTFFALFQRSAPMLVMAFAIRSVTDVFDVIHAVLANTVNMELLFFASVLILVSAFAIYRLRGCLKPN